MAAEQATPPKRRLDHVVRTNTSALYLGLLYMTILVIPWALTAHYSGTTTATTDVKAVVDVLSVLSALATMPLLYALLARAAVVYTQRTRPNKQTPLNVRQLFSLADRRFVRDSWRGRADGGTKLAVFGTGIIILGKLSHISKENVRTITKS